MAGVYDPFGYGANAGPNFTGPAYGWNVPGVDPAQTGSISGPLSGRPTATGGTLSGLRGLLDPQYALPIAAQLIGGATPAESFAGALNAAGPAIGDIRKRAAINAWLKSRSTGEPLSAEAQQMIAEDPALARKLAEHDLGVDVSGERFTTGLAPQYVQDAQGNWHQYLMDRTGVPKEVQYPPGSIVSPPVTTIDTGLGTRTISKIGGGQVQPDVSKNVEATTAAGVVGKGEGDATVIWKSMKSKLPGLQAVVTQLNDLSEKATYTPGGQLIDWTINAVGARPRDSAVARTKYIAIVDNQILPLLRDTFGAAFTEREGASLKVTMGDPDLSPVQKQAVLKAFIEQKQRDIEAAAVQSGQAEAPGAAPAGAPAAAPAAGVTHVWDPAAGLRPAQ